MCFCVISYYPLRVSCVFLCFYHPLSILSVILHLKCSKCVFSGSKVFLCYFLLPIKSFVCVFCVFYHPLSVLSMILHIMCSKCVFWFKSFCVICYCPLRVSCVFLCFYHSLSVVRVILQIKRSKCIFWFKSAFV